MVTTLHQYHHFLALTFSPSLELLSPSLPFPSLPLFLSFLRPLLLPLLLPFPPSLPLLLTSLPYSLPLPLSLPGQYFPSTLSLITRNVLHRYRRRGRQHTRNTWASCSGNRTLFRLPIHCLHRLLHVLFRCRYLQHCFP